ncbi:hypothetical protein Dda_2790 [Drechslerella dactyloides]|uniref:Cyclin n=1 Tax=Drechslerella dactyloides TaxID=74499 RepID=A0AAD6J053_DREDA|nr:hypothetical protein Dda_2790 [Drechslerella dactyloides]
MNSTTLAYPQDSIPPFSHSAQRNSAYSTIERLRSEYHARKANDTTRIFTIPSPPPLSRYSSRESLRTPPSAGTLTGGSSCSSSSSSSSSSTIGSTGTICSYTDYSNALLPTSGNVQTARSHIRQYDHSSASSTIPSTSDCGRPSLLDKGKRMATSPPSRRGSFTQQMKDDSRSSRRSSTSSLSLSSSSNSNSNAGLSLRIPETINLSGGSLAEFAAKITCLFWFESPSELSRVAASTSSPITPPRALRPDSIPSMSFKKWVTTILSTTQVSANVILLALLFIYRLKQSNPSVKGKAGSEYRLLTVALMLGNKFLDDNTYTNKTWAEVSGITVSEIHVMEVEFLSNMRYSLFTSAKEWEEWQKKLGRFGTFWDMAQRAVSSPISSIAPLPSPINMSHNSPPYAHEHSPTTAYPPAPPAINAPITNVLPKNKPMWQQYREDWYEAASRKRSLEDIGMQPPPAKRVSRSGPSSAMNQYPPALTIPTPSPNPYALHLPINPNAPMPIPPAALQMPQQHQTYYPATRAMSTVYPSSTSSWAPSQTATSSWALPPAQLPAPAPSAPVNLGPYPTSRHTSPYLLNSTSSSPSTLVGTNNNSPSVFLTSRESPYRPVRTVSTLLVPQHGAEAQHLGHDQMQYQPLTKARNEYRQGPVPYMQTDYWPHANPTVPAFE